MSAMEVEAPQGGDEGAAAEDDVFRAGEMRIAAVFHPSVNPALDPPTIDTMDFHDDGRWMVTADSENEIMLIDTVGGKVEKRSHAKANPVGMIRYTHHEQSVLCSSHRRCGAGPHLARAHHHHHHHGRHHGRRHHGHRRNHPHHPRHPHSVPNSDTAHDIRYLSLYDNTYLRLFHGHTEEVISMAMCPADDTFVTGSKDRSVSQSVSQVARQSGRQSGRHARTWPKRGLARPARSCWNQTR